MPHRPFTRARFNVSIPGRGVLRTRVRRTPRVFTITQARRMALAQRRRGLTPRIVRIRRTR